MTDTRGTDGSAGANATAETAESAGTTGAGAASDGGRYDVLRYPSPDEPRTAVEAGRGAVVVEERLREARGLLKRRAFGVAVVSAVPVVYALLSEAPLLVGAAVAVAQFVGLMYAGAGRYDFVPELVAEDVSRETAVEEYEAVIADAVDGDAPDGGAAGTVDPDRGVASA